MRKTFIKKRRVVGIIMALLSLSMLIGMPVIFTRADAIELVSIVLDAGHGGCDGGVKGVRTGVLESELNLKMSKIVGEYFSSCGFRVVQVRKNERGLNYAGARYTKKSDLDERIKKINNAQPAAVVSLHMNFCSIASRRGAQVFYDRKSDKSALLADCIQSSLNLSFNKPETGREYEALTAEKYLLSNVEYPIVIVECGFLSNPTDERNLINPDYRAALGHAIFCGVSEYLYATSNNSI